MKKKLLFCILILGLLFIGQSVLAEDGICPFDREMGLGDKNSAIKELQSFLALDKQVYSGPSTGYFGPATQKGVRNFQEKAGLLANGRIDLATATVLCQIYLSYKSSEPINANNDLEASSSCFVTSEYLELGDSSDEVLKLQKWLADGGFYPERKFTGYYGGLTAQAVKRFQKSQGVIQTGIVGPKTKAIMCGGSVSLSSTGGETDITLSGLKVNPEQIDVGTSVNILVQEKNISNATADKHITSLYINEKEVSSNQIKSLSAGEENLSINYNWKCPQKGIYIFKIFVDSSNSLIETNKFNNVLVFPVNCGGVTNDLRYSCSSETQTCEIDASGSMTLSECADSCKIGDKSLPDLMVSDFSPKSIKINETLPLIITEKNDGNSKAERHGYDIIVGFGGEEKPTSAVFNELEAKSTQEAKGNWTCTVPGVYTFTVELDPNNDIKESNEANNKKIFKVECSDADGNVPKDEEQKEENKEEEKTGDGGTGLPDLVVTLDPTKMDNGKNNIKFTIKNKGTKDVASKFYFLIELLDADGKIVQSYDPMEVPGFGAGKEHSDVLFKDGATCDSKSPFKIRATIDSTKVISEKLENNNYAESTCGTVKPPAGGNSNGGGGNEEGVKLPPCASGDATLEIKSLTSREVQGLGNDRVLEYVIGNNNGSRAEGVKVEFYKIDATTKSQTIKKSQNISSITGCSTSKIATYSSSVIYTCEDKEQTVNMVVKYANDTKSVSKTIDVKCEAKADAGQTLYCETDKAVNAAGEIRISPGDNILYTLKASGNTGVKLDTTKATWKGADTSSGITAYKKFNGFVVGRYTVGVSVRYIVEDSVKGTSTPVDVICPGTTVVITNNTTNPGKVPNFNTDTQCISNLDLKSSMTGTNNFCFTNYIQDLNSKCKNIEYSWETASDLKITSKNSKTFCIDKSLLSKWPAGTSDALKSTISCDYEGQKYSQSVFCKINAFSSGSGSGSGNLTASCSVSPSTPKTGESVSFSSVANASGFASGKCTTKTYSWSGCSSTSSTCNRTYGNTETGAKSVTVTVKCADDSTKTASASCNFNVASSSAAPTPTTGSCTCNATKCSFGTSGSYTGYTCQWVMNNTALSSTTSRCVDIQKGGATITQASVKVTKDSDNSVIFNGSCTTGQ